jgi:hypothetical protein
MNSLKPLSTIFYEATFVGVGLILLYVLTEYVFKNLNINIKDPLNYKYITLFVSGFIFHIVFEYSGVNLWYSKEYCKLIK